MNPVGGYVDTHCHLYDKVGTSAAEIVDGARAAGVTAMIDVGCDAASTARAIATAAMFDGVWASAGLHPHDAVNGVDTIVPFLDDPHVVAIGECGLDYYYDHSPRETQREVFAAHVQLAHERRLPMIVHTRDAWADTFDILASEGTPERTVFHCFTGGPDEARRCLDLGAFLSFSGIVTFKNSTDVQDAARICPAERMLAETDSPYLAPVPHRGATNRPAYVTHVVAALAALRGTSVDEVRRSTATAACLAFPGVHP